jgi:putative membrane protein
MDASYHWLKALHIIAVIAWMCGMLYLPRLFVYHSGTKPGSEASEIFKVMERKLMRLIINPAMIATWIFGLWLAVKLNAFDVQANGAWLHYKLGLVLLLQITHAMMSRYRKAFARDERPKSEKFFRFFNEIPAILMVLIVIMVVVKPV